MTTIEDVVTYADGSVANGQIVLTWPIFTVGGVAIAAGQEAYPIVDGAISITLYANLNAQPFGTYYTATYELDEGAVYDEYWVVPQTATATIAQVRAQFPETPSIMINANQLTGSGATLGQFLGWNGSSWIPMYPSLINFTPNTIGLSLTATPGDVLVTSSPAYLGTDLVLNVPDAGPASRGVVNTTAQTFAGNKTFSGNVTIAGTLTVTGAGAPIGDPTTTLGDLIVRGATAPPTRLGVGATAGMALVVDGTQALGMKWAVLSVIAGPGLAGGGAISPSVSLSAPVMKGSGTGHAAGIVPDPGGVGGSTHYLREDGVWSVPSGQGMGDPTTTLGDLIVRDTTAPNRLAVGSTNGLVLTVDNTQPLGVAWEPIAGALSPLTTKGDIYIYDTANNRLPVGADNFALIADSGVAAGLQWQAITNSFKGRTGAVVPATSDYTAAQVTNAVDSTGSYVDPAWLTINWSYLSGPPPPGLGSPLTTKGDVYVFGTANARLPVGIDGQILTSDSTQPLGLRWITPAPGGVTSFNTRTGAVVPAAGDYTAAQVTNAVNQTGAYANPAWITSLAYSKLSGAPAIPTVYWQAGTGGAIYYNGGNVGIGTSSPSQLLTLTKQVSGGVGPVLLMTNDAGALSDAASIQFSDGGQLRGALRMSINSSPYGVDFMFLTGSAGTTEVMRITTTGNVGIGTSSPAHLLDVGNGTTAASVYIYGNVSGGLNSYVRMGDVAGFSIGFGAAVGGVEKLHLEGGSGVSYFNGGGNVGIGTSNPGAPLHCAVNGSGMIPALRLDNSANTSDNGAWLSWYNGGLSGPCGQIGFTRAGAGTQQDLLFYLTPHWDTTAPVEKIRFTGTGNVGIGTTSPQVILQAGTNPNFGGIEGRTDGPTGAANYARFGGFYSTNPIPGAAIAFFAQGSGGQRGSIGLLTKNVDDNTSGVLIRMWVDQGGNVGIGTSSPQAWLDVSAPSLGGGGNTVRFHNAAGANDSWIHYGTNGDIYLRSAANAGKIVIQDTGGNVGIGTGFPSYKLDVNGQVRSQSGGYIFPDGTTQATAAGATYWLSDGTGIYYNSPVFVNGQPHNLSGWWFYVGGTAGGSTIWNQTSDVRIKENIQPVTEDPLPLLHKLNWVRYEHNGLAGTTRGTKGIGLLAHELAAVMPEALAPPMHIALRPGEEETDLLSIGYHAVWVQACRAIVALTGQIDALRAEIQQLKGGKIS